MEEHIRTGGHSEEEHLTSLIGHDAFQLLVDEVHPLVCWATKGSQLVVKVT